MLFFGTDMTQSFVGLRTYPPSDSVGLISGSSAPNSPSLSVDTARNPTPIPTCANISFSSNCLHSTSIDAILPQRCPTAVDNSVLSSSSD